MNDGREPTKPTTESATEPAADDRDEVPGNYGTLYVVGIGSGFSSHMMKWAEELISTSDCVVASNLYQGLLRDDGTLPLEGSDDGPEVVHLSMGKQVELAREAFERVRDDEDMVYVSGGDLNVYGKSDLMFTMVKGDEVTGVPIEIVPGVTAALDGVTIMGAPLSNDFCTVSLSDKWRGWDEIEEKLRAAAINGFVIVLYNCWRSYERAIDVVCEEWTDDVPVGVFNDADRGEAGRNLDDETFSVTTLDDAKVHDGDVGGMGTSILTGTHETEPWDNDYQTYLATSRGGHDIDDFQLMSDSDTTAESNYGDTTTESTESTDTTNSKSNCGGTKTEIKTDTTSNCSVSSSTTNDDSASKCGGSSGGSKKEQAAEKVEATIEDFDGEPGQLVAIGLGSGRASEMTTLAKDTLREAGHTVGYTTYIEPLPDDVIEGAEDIYSTPMCGEISRTEKAIGRALAGNDVAIVGNGDPSVYALASLMLEILGSKSATTSMVDFDVVAGVPAAQSCAVRLSTPLVNDTVTINLSDHLTSMPTIGSRLRTAVKEGLTIAIYNPWSRKCRSNYEKCREILLEHRAPDTPVGIVHGAGRDDEEVEIVDLGDLPDLGETDLVNMTTTLFVGNEETYVWDDRMATPRSYEQKYEY